MNKIALACCALSALLLPLTKADADGTTAHVDPSVKYGVWQGWGVSLSWWANVVGGFPDDARHEYLTKAFDLKGGLGLNVVRYNIGGGENPDDLPPHPSVMQYRARMPGFEPAPGKWDWSADENQRRVLNQAIKMGANQLEAFSNSPPYWMTASGSVTGAVGGAENLPEANDREFTDYLAAVVKHFQEDWGVTFRDVEPLNEPSGTWWKYGNYQEGCHFYPAHQALVIKSMAASLQKAGVVGTTVTASDESFISQGVDTFASYDPETLSDLSKINVHSYGEGDRARLSELAKGAGKDLWLSEYGDSDGSGMKMSRQILKDVQGLHPSAWVYWQMADKATGWGFLKNPLLDETNTAYTVNPKYYVMGQYSRYIRPGYIIIDSGTPDALAAYDPRGKRVVIVATNDGNSPETISFDLSGFRSIGKGASVRRTSPTEQWAHLLDVPVHDNKLSVSLPADSVTTYVVGQATDYLGAPYQIRYSLLGNPSGLAATFPKREGKLFIAFQCLTKVA